jgi:hypothetical protein
MLKTNNLTHYYGEFGYFNFVLLGHLEEYFSKKNTKFFISTFPDYYSLLENKFKGKFQLTETLLPAQKDINRCYHRIQDEEFNRSLENKGYMPLDKFLNCEILNWQEGRKMIKPIKTVFGQMQKNKEFISVVCRKRQLDPDRNLSLELWQSILKIIKAAYGDYKIVFHGLKEETLQISDSIFCDNILDSIDYLNKSFFLISSMSGFAQFASNCGCNIVQIGPRRQMIDYNPFKKTNSNIERDEIHKLHEVLKQFF